MTIDPGFSVVIPTHFLVKNLVQPRLLFSLLQRREFLNLLGSAIAVSLWGCFRDQSAAEETTRVAQAPFQPPPTCIVRPQQTEGPYFVDERLNRADIRSDPSNNSIKSGVPLRLAIRVAQVQSSTCVPLQGAIVDIWHCDAQGVYSDVNDPRSSTVGQKFLRGYQITDANGLAEFLTIFPGWYPGRTVHIHFKIRTVTGSQSNSEFTSQLYFDDPLTDQIHNHPAYTNRGQRTVLNSQDGIFQQGGEQLIVQLMQTTQGYSGLFNIGLETVEGMGI